MILVVRLEPTRAQAQTAATLEGVPASSPFPRSLPNPKSTLHYVLASQNSPSVSVLLMARASRLRRAAAATVLHAIREMSPIASTVYAAVVMTNRAYPAHGKRRGGFS
jgi:hypothetical protein